MKNINIVGIPESTIKGIYNKACELVSNEGSLVQAPGTEGMMVESKSGHKPHFVSKQKNGKLVCDDECRMFQSTHLCAHTLAAAERMGVLGSFILWRQQSKKNASLTSLVLNDAPRGSGKKGGRAPTKRYTKLRSKDIRKNFYPIQTGLF